jgi:hypothetical protein
MSVDREEVRGCFVASPTLSEWFPGISARSLTNLSSENRKLRCLFAEPSSSLKAAERELEGKLSRNFAALSVLIANENKLHFCFVCDNKTKENRENLTQNNCWTLSRNVMWKLEMKIDEDPQLNQWRSRKSINAFKTD